MTLRDFKQLIIDSLQLEGLTPDIIGDDQALFEEGLGLDSVDALELVVAIEKRLGVRIRGHEVSREIFASPSALFRYVEERLGFQKQTTN